MINESSHGSRQLHTEGSPSSSKKRTSSTAAPDDATLAQSMLTAIRDCTPLHFSAELGSAIAGQVLDIRFIGRNQGRRVVADRRRDRTDGARRQRG